MADSKIKKSVLSFPVMFQKTEEIENSDNRFTKVKIWLMHTGRNWNQSEFTYEVIENAISTLSYIPIVGFIENNALNEKDFSDHRFIEIKKDGKKERKYLGSAYGVVLSVDENDAHFEKKICEEDGIEREFLVCNGVMWNFLDGSEIMNRDIVKDHSVELDEKSIEGYEDENGIFHFTKFSFRAACILGGTSQPAMTGSCVETQFTISDFVRDIQSEISNKYNEFTRLVNQNNNSFTKNVDKKNNQNNKGGITVMPNVNFAQTLLEHFEDVSTIVSQHETVKNVWGDEVPRYYLRDIQDNEVIVVDKSDNYHIYGFPFTMNGDKTDIDFSCGKRKKTQYVDYDEGTQVPEGMFDFGKHISDIENSAFNKVEDAQNKITEFETKVADAENKVTVAETAKTEAETNYSQVKAELDDLKPKYDEFVRAEQARINAELDDKKNAEFAKYEAVLADCVEFEALKAKKDDMSLEKIEGECAILYARKNLGQTNFSKSRNGFLTSGIIDDGSDNEKGYIETKYGNIPVKR